MASINSIHVPTPGEVAVSGTPLAFPWTEVSKAAQEANGGSGSA